MVMNRQELGSSPVLPDPQPPTDFVWSAQTQLSSQYRPQSVVFSPRVICSQPDTFGDNCTWPSVSQPESSYAPAVEQRWMSREQPDIHSTEAQWPFSDDESNSSPCCTPLSSTIHLSSENGQGRSTSYSYHDNHPSTSLATRYQGLCELARDLDHLPPHSESGSGSSQSQPLSTLTTAYQDLYERARIELDNNPPSDQSDSSSGQLPSPSSQNENRIDFESDSNQELPAPGDFPEEDHSSGSGSFQGPPPSYDSGYDDTISGDHRLEVIDQEVMLHPHQPGPMAQLYRGDVEQVLVIEVVPAVPQIHAEPANQNPSCCPIDQRNVSSQTSQLHLTLNRAAFDCHLTQSRGSCSSTDEPSHGTLSMAPSTSRLVHRDNSLSNGSLTENVNLRSYKTRQEPKASPITINSNSSQDKSSFDDVCRQVNTCSNSLSPSGDSITAPSTADVFTITSSGSESVAFFPAPPNASSLTVVSSQRCHLADITTKVNMDMYGLSNIDPSTSHTPSTSNGAKRAHSEIEADDEATQNGFPDISPDDRILRTMSRVRRSRRYRNEIRVINGINRHIEEPCNKLPLPKRKRSLSPSVRGYKRARTAVDRWQRTASGHDLRIASGSPPVSRESCLQEVPAESARHHTNDCHQTQTSGHDTGSGSDSHGSLQKVQAEPNRPESPVLQSRKRKLPTAHAVEDAATNKSKKGEEMAQRPEKTTYKVFQNLCS
ncbi:uncharacterized protein [Haliotis cracherodii]|uniref:uncharacterized protein n=1 Tax=Haliotis cracherodii TaxID=6455 RepID=UPI0039EA289E